MADPSLENRLFLLDGSSLAYRAFFALPESITTRDGFPANAIYGLSQMLLKIVTEYRPASIVGAWEAREKTFRHDEYEEYKAQRPHMPEPLSQQWSRFPELVEAFGIVNLVQPGYEADDILGTLAEEAKRQGVGSIVVTGDRDAMQVVDDDIWVMSTGRGITDVKIYTPAAVLERFGVTPAAIPDYIGLKGDTSDNIPGVPGVARRPRRRCCSSSAASTRCTSAWTRSRATSGARCWPSTKAARASPSAWRRWCSTCRSRKISSSWWRAPATCCPWRASTPSSRSTSSAPCGAGCGTWPAATRPRGPRALKPARRPARRLE